MNAVIGAVEAPDVTLVNGEVASHILATDRGLHYGDGVFETITCLRGRARFLTLHLERLSEGCRRLSIPLASVEALRAEVEQLAREGERSTIKLIVTRGPAVARGYGFTGSEQSTRLLLRYPQRESSPVPASVRVGVSTIRLGENPALAGLKHLSRLEQVLARAELHFPDVWELLMFSSSGLLISGTMSNVFLVQEQALRTPRLDLCGVSGIMRRVVLREARRVGLRVEECELRAADLEAASEVFLTNSRLGILPVAAVEGRPLAGHELTNRLAGHIAPLLSEPVDA